MSTLSIPLTPNLEAFVKAQVKNGYAENKAEVVRKALRRLEQEQAVFAVLESEQEMREGKILHGNLRKLAKKIK